MTLRVGCHVELNLFADGRGIDEAENQIAVSSTDPNAPPRRQLKRDHSASRAVRTRFSLLAKWKRALGGRSLGLSIS